MRIPNFLIGVLTAIFLLQSASAATETAPINLPKSTADHSKFKILDQDFASGPEVTKACLSCHTEASKQIHQTQHWKWEFVNPDTQQVLG